MIDESFFDENGEVKPDRVDEFVAHLPTESAKSGRKIAFTAPAMRALAAHRRKRAEAERNKGAGIGVEKGPSAENGVAVDIKGEG